jgi:hypothetical protein
MMGVAEMRFVRYGVLVTVLVASLLAGPPVQAAPAQPSSTLAGCGAIPPPPPGARNLGNMYFCGYCSMVGDEGVSSGAWVDYRCVPRPVGLDVFYFLYVWP